MKKFLKGLLCFALVIVSVFAFAACKDKGWSETTNDTSKVYSNGGILAVVDGYMYFVNGTKTNDGTGNKGNIVKSAIYKVKVDENGKIANDATYEKVVNALVGFENGSIFVYGNFIYYTTPCNDVNKNGEVLYNKTCIMRYDIAKNKSQLIYTTNVSKEEFVFGYYKNGTDLYLAVYEKGETKKLTTIKIGSEMTTVIEKTDVQAAIFAENGGEAVGAQSYIYYTLSADIMSEYTSGTRVYKVLPNGNDDTKISEGKTISLLTVRGNKLLYTYNKNTYASSVVDGNMTLSYETKDIVTYIQYETVIYNEDLSVIVMDGTTLRKIKYENGVKTIDRAIYMFDDNTTVEFVGITKIAGKDNLIYVVSNTAYKINVEDETGIIPIKLSKTSVDKTEDKSLLLPEIYGNYLYVFHTDDKTKVTYMYAIDLTASEAGDATQIGVAE